MLSYRNHDFSNGFYCRAWLVGLLLFSLVSPSMVSADIFEWEWVDPLDHSQGKQQSTTLVPDGAGLVPGPGLNPGHKNLTQAYLIDFDLTRAIFSNRRGGATLTNADLSGSNLTNANFRNATLTSAYLNGSNLTDADFYNATLTGANFAGAEVRGARFYSTTDSGFTSSQLYSTASYQTGNLTGIRLGSNDLTGWDFAGKNLTDAYFSSATLTGANFAGAEVRGARLYSTTDSGFTSSQLYSTASYQAGDLTEIGLVGNDLAGWDFVGKNLTDASFVNTTLTSTNLSGANLTDASFRKARLLGADLSSANLTGADFDEATLPGANLSGANLTGANFDDATLDGADLSGAVLSGANLRASTLNGTDFTGAVVNGVIFRGATHNGFTADQLYSTASYQTGDLSGIDFLYNDLAGWDFRGINLTNANLQGANLSGADFTDAEIKGVKFSTRNFEHSKGLRSEQLYSTASYKNGDLSGIVFWSVDMRGWNLSGTNLTNVTFYAGELNGADLSYADLSNATLDVGIHGADFTGAEVRGAYFGYLTHRDGFSAEQLYSTASYQEGDLTGILLDGNNMESWDFAGKNLTNASFWRAILSHADLSGANLTGADLSDSYPVSANFKGANLTGADMGDADLKNADLSGANLTSARFYDSSITSADYTATNFSGAEVRNAFFGSVTRHGFTAQQLYSTASYQTGDLSGIQLVNNDLKGWDFAGKDLASATFIGSRLYETDLSGSNLNGVRFISAQLTNADFSYADARGATNLRNVHLAIKRNFIHPDGHVAGLDITADEVMRLWDYNLATAIPIFVEDAMSIDSNGTLRAVFEDNAWGSTLTFAAGIGVSLDGTLELLIDPREGSDVFSMVGITFDLFDWTGVTPSGTFAQIITSAGLTWDTSNLYTTGEVTLLAVIPEPSSMVLVLLGLASCGWYRRRSTK